MLNKNDQVEAVSAKKLGWHRGKNMMNKSGHLSNKKVFNRSNVNDKLKNETIEAKQARLSKVLKSMKKKTR